MNLSAFVYDVLDEVSKLEKLGAEASADQGKVGYEILLRLEEVNTLLQTTLERLKGGDKDLRIDLERTNQEIKEVNEEIDASKARSKENTKLILELKDLEKKLPEQLEDRKRQIEQKLQEALVDLKKDDPISDNLSPEEVEKMRQENEEMRATIQTAIDNFKTKEGEYRQKIEGLRQEFGEMQASITKEIQEFQQQTMELQKVKTERDVARTRMDSIRQRVNVYHEKVPKFFEMIEFKEKQYDKYRGEIREILLRFKKAWLENQQNHELLRLSNKLYLELHQEVG